MDGINCSITEWVLAASKDRITFRQAIHIVLNAITDNQFLQDNMVMKGGILLAIRYKSSRFTEDIDFSTNKSLAQIDISEFEEELNNSLIISSDELNYNVLCRLQTLILQPKNNPQASFPSLKLTIGYARKNIPNEVRRLENKNCPNTIKIDYSFNEITNNIDNLQLSCDSQELKVYAVVDIISEKIRSLIQQISRNRNRRQDIYDLNFLLESVELTDREKFTVLLSLIEKSKGRLPDNIIKPNTLDDPEIYKRAENSYTSLKDEIDGELPDFESSYKLVNDFYKSLPWQSINENK